MALHFDALPDHPPPIAGESLTGYLTFLMERNGHTSLRALKALCFPPRGINVSHRDQTRDFPLADWGPLSARCGVAVAGLEALTWEMVCRKFGIAPNRNARHSFLAGCIVPMRRFCPRCLTEERRYLLAWGLQSLRGCVRHGSAFLECCTACRTPIPYLSVPLRVGWCPTCGQDLSTLDAPALDEAARASVVREAQDIAFLLTPTAWRLPPAMTTSALGRAIVTLGQQRGLDLAAGAQQMGVAYEELRRCAALGHGHWHLSLADLWRWLRHLDVRLAEVVAQASEPRDLVTRLTTILHARWEVGHRPRQAEVQQALGISNATWYGHPTLPSRFHALVAAQQRRVEEHAVAAAIQQLSKAEQTISLGAVQRLTGISKGRLYEAPLLRQAILTARTAQERAEEQVMTERVRKALMTLQEQGHPITWRQVGLLIGKSTTYLQARDPLVTLIEPWLGERDGAVARARRQEEGVLLAQMQHAWSRLTECGLPVTAQSVAVYLGTTTSFFYQYPRVARWLHDLAAAQPVTKTARLQAMEQDDRQTIATITREMEQRGVPVTYGGAATHLDGQRQSDPIVQRQKRFLALWLAEQVPTDATEDELLAQVLAAHRALGGDGSIMTCRALAEQVGVSLTLLRHYPRIEAFLRQVAHAGTRTHPNTPAALAREATLLAQLDDAALDLARCGVPLTRAALCRQMQCPPARLNHYPAVVARLQALRAVTGPPPPRTHHQALEVPDDLPF